MEVERLKLLTYPGETTPLIDNFKTKAFANGIRVPDIKLAVFSSQKKSFALAQETARTILRPPVSKVRKMEIVEEDSLLNKLREMPVVKVMAGNVTRLSLVRTL